MKNLVWIFGLLLLAAGPAYSQTAGWEFPTSAAVTVGVGDAGKVLASDSVVNPSTAITVTLPNPVTVGAGWLMGFSEGNGIGFILNPPLSTYILTGQKSLQSLTIPSNTNYEYIALESDGTNFRLLSTTDATARINGIIGTGGGRLWSFMNSTSYGATVADNGTTLSSKVANGAVNLTLPSTPLVPNSWAVNLYADAGNAINVQPNSTQGGTLIDPQGNTVTSYTVAANTENGYATVSFDGLSTYRVMLNPILQGAWVFPGGSINLAQSNNKNVVSSLLSGGSLAASLPTAPTAGWEATFVSAGTALPIVISASGGPQIRYPTTNGLGAAVSSITVAGTGESVKLQFDGVDYRLLNATLSTELTLSGVASGSQFSLVNNGSTGTILNRLVSIDSTGKAVVATAGAVNGIAGIVTAGAGTTGSATINTSGIASCVFDSPTTQGDLVQLSTTVAGECNDAGNGIVLSSPAVGTTTQSVGTVLSTNGASGTYSVALRLGPASLGTVPGGYIMGSSSNTPQIVYVGDSLTFGLQPGHPTVPYNTYITLPTYNGLTINPTNIGVSGWTLPQMYAAAPINLNPLFNSRAGLNIAVIWGGTNDIAVNGDTPGRAFSSLETFAQHERQLGFKVIVVDMISRTFGLTASQIAFNNLIRKNWSRFADGFADLAANPNLGGNTLDPTYYNTDGIHLTDTGYALVGSIVQTAITNLVNGADPHVLVPGPNILLNPSADIDQPNEGASISITNAGTVVPLIDAWYAAASTAASGITAQQVTDAPPGFAHSLKITVGTGAGIGATDFLTVFNKVAGRDIINLGYGSTTPAPSCRTDWVKSSVGGILSEYIIREDLQSEFLQQTVSLVGGVWTKVTLCLPGDPTSSWTSSFTSAARVGFGLAGGSSAVGSAANVWQGPTTAYGVTGQSSATLSTNGATFQITGSKWENSSVPTPFVARKFTEELSLLQPYFQKSYNVGTALGTISNAGADFLFGTYAGPATGHEVKLAPRMVCTSPTIALYSPATGTIGKIQDSQNSVDVTGTVYINTGSGGFSWTASPSSGNIANMLAQWTASCRL